MNINKIKELYESQINTINVDYEIINIAKEDYMEVLLVLSRTDNINVRYELADYLVCGNPYVYIIESQQYRGALFVTTDYDEVLKEWFTLSYIKEIIKWQKLKEKLNY